MKGEDGIVPEDINGYLIKPFQRICRYVLLLKELIKNTPQDWPDYKDLQDSMDSIDAIVRQANETKRVMDNLMKIQEIQSSLDNVPLPFFLLSSLLFPFHNVNGFILLEKKRNLILKGRLNL